MASELGPDPPIVAASSASAVREAAFRAKADWHAKQALASPQQKIATLLRLQLEVLPILRARRALEPHERPWPIEP